MKIKLLCICLIFLLCSSITAQGMTLYYDGQVHEYNDVITLKINGTMLDFDVPPVIINDRTLIPSRGLFEQLGATVIWRNNTRQVVITLDDTEVILTIDSIVAKVNGDIIMLDMPAKIINDRAMIPVRFVSEHLGMTVGWENDTKTVTVDQKFKYTITDVSYHLKTNRVTITADKPILNVQDSLFSDTKIVLDFKDAKVLYGRSGKIVPEGDFLNEVRWAQYRVVPYIGRVVVETSAPTPYEITYSSDKKQLYLDMKTEENKAPGTTVSPSPTPSVTPAPSVTPTPSTPSQVSATVLNKAAKGLVVVIDPGHGGSDSGAVGRTDNTATYEKDINLSIALKANAYLQSAGVTTHMTRTKDITVELNDRPIIANSMNTVLFLSVHNNSFINSEAHGTTVLYYPDGDPTSQNPMTSYRFATILQEELVNALGLYDRGITNGEEMLVINSTIAPAVITEIAFISNPEELELLKSEEFQDKAAKALCRAVIRALNEMTS